MHFVLGGIPRAGEAPSIRPKQNAKKRPKAKENLDGKGLEPLRIAPYGPKPYAYTNSATRPKIIKELRRLSSFKFMGYTGIEPVTLRLRGVCSTS